MAAPIISSLTGRATLIRTYSLSDAFSHLFTDGTRLLADRKGADRTSIFAIRPTDGLVSSANAYLSREVQFIAYDGVDNWAIYKEGAYGWRLVKVVKEVQVDGRTKWIVGAAQRVGVTPNFGLTPQADYIVQGFTASASKLFLAVSGPNLNQGIYELSKTTGLATAVSNKIPFLGTTYQNMPAGITFVGSKLYAFGGYYNAGGDRVEDGQELREINLTTTVATQVGSAIRYGLTSDVYAGGIASDGIKLYFATDVNDGENTEVGRLFELNQTTGVSTRIGTADYYDLPIPDGRTKNIATVVGMAYDGSSLFILEGYRKILCMLDKKTGVATQVGSATDYGTSGLILKGLAWNGTDLYSFGTFTETGSDGILRTFWALFQINKSTGVATRVGTAKFFGVNENIPIDMAWSGTRMYFLGRNVGLGEINLTTGVVSNLLSRPPYYAYDRDDFGVARYETLARGIAYNDGEIILAGDNENALFIGLDTEGIVHRLDPDIRNFGLSERDPVELEIVDGTLYMLAYAGTKVYDLSSVAFPATQVVESQAFTFDLRDFVEGEDSISLRSSYTKPSWLTFSGGVLSGTAPSVTEDTDYNVLLTATNTDGSTDFGARIRVLALPPPPTVTGDLTFEVFEGRQFSQELLTFVKGADTIAFQPGDPQTWVYLQDMHLLGVSPDEDADRDYTLNLVATNTGGSTNFVVIVRVLYIPSKVIRVFDPIVPYPYKPIIGCAAATIDRIYIGAYKVVAPSRGKIFVCDWDGKRYPSEDFDVVEDAAFVGLDYYDGFLYALFQSMTFGQRFPEIPRSEVPLYQSYYPQPALSVIKYTLEGRSDGMILPDSDGDWNWGTLRRIFGMQIVEDFAYTLDLTSVLRYTPGLSQWVLPRFNRNINRRRNYYPTIDLTEFFAPLDFETLAKISQEDMTWRGFSKFTSGFYICVFDNGSYKLAAFGWNGVRMPDLDVEDIGISEPFSLAYDGVSRHAVIGTDDISVLGVEPQLPSLRESVTQYSGFTRFEENFDVYRLGRDNNIIEVLASNVKGLRETNTSQLSVSSSKSIRQQLDTVYFTLRKTVPGVRIGDFVSINVTGASPRGPAVERWEIIGKQVVAARVEIFICKEVAI